MQAKTRLTNLAAFGVLLAAILSCLPAFARTVAQKKQLAREQFDKAEQIRAEFLSIAQGKRTRNDYQHVTEAYRRVYYIAPTYSHADEAVVNVGDFLAETGRIFKDSKLIEAAVGQYEFLRREYPGSKFRVDALFAMGLIYKEDLDDTEKAKSTFEEFLKRYPRSHLTDDAKKALAELGQPSAKKASKRQTASSVRDAVLGPMQPAAQPAAAERPKATKPVPVTEPAKEEPVVLASIEEKPQKSEHRFPLVTGIRFWSTPDYTRIAIDLETEVKYEASRIDDPDRIFFDLHDTKLSSSLIGKTFEVEDGFLRKIRIAQYQREMTRVVLDVDKVSDYSAFLLPNPYRLIIDIHGKKASRSTTVATAQTPKVQASATTQASAPQKQIGVAPTSKPGTNTPPKESPKVELAVATAPRVEPAKTIAEPKPSQARATNDADESSSRSASVELKATATPTSSPTYESVSPRDEILPKSRRTKRVPEPDLAHEARPTSNGERSLTRALGLKIGKIVVDAGHGGHDTGTIGPNGLQEKDLVLDVALRLGKLLQSKMGADVVYTRSDDTFVPLENRTAIANQEQADLFISIHANSSRDSSARGIETYYLNFTSSAEALEVAARENAVSEKSIHELQDLVKKITLKDKIDESREFAANVQRSLYSGISAKNPAVRNRGVKKAPFIVLIGANMPSILAEISFISNPTDEKRLFTPEYRQKIAEYLYRGISRYIDGLSGVKVATHGESSAVPSKTAKASVDSDR